MADLDFLSIETFATQSFFSPLTGPGFIEDNKFEVIFSGTTNLLEALNLQTDDKKLKYNVKSVQLPTISIEDTNDLLQQRIQRRSYGDLSISFFEDES